eukprot:14025458-Alexandrium_andersonii.AAC.1
MARVVVRSLPPRVVPFPSGWALAPGPWRALLWWGFPLVAACPALFLRVARGSFPGGVSPWVAVRAFAVAGPLARGFPLLSAAALRLFGAAR